MRLVTREEKGFKPMLAPNSETGKFVDVEADLAQSLLYTYSNKKDGARTETFREFDLSRALKPIPSIQVNAMARELARQASHIGVIESEFYAHGFTIGEIVHFFNTADVTSDKTKKKYALEWKKTKQGTATYTKKVKGVPVEVSWKYPGRDPQWCTEWHDELGFHVFDQLNDLDDKRTKIQRYEGLVDMFGNELKSSGATLIKQFDLEHPDAVYQAYDQAVLDGYEGLMAFLKSSPYKFGRWSYSSGMVYKLKDDNQEFDGEVIAIVEGTKAKEGVERNINELGRSMTSKLKEDREPSGMATGILVKLEDGLTLTVSLSDYNHAERRALLYMPETLVGEWIRFSGMVPSKIGGVPRHAIYIKGNIRDAK
jgi:hypothetical protein